MYVKFWVKGVGVNRIPRIYSESTPAFCVQGKGEKRFLLSALNRLSY